MCDRPKKYTYDTQLVLCTANAGVIKNNGDTSDVTFQLQRPIHNVAKAKLAQVFFPAGAVYNVSAHFQNNVFEFIVGATTYTCTIPEGNYSTTTLAIALDAEMTNLVSNTWTIIFDETTFKLTITGTAAFSLLLTNYPYTAKLLGFPATTSSSATSLIGSQQYNLVLPYHYYITLDNIPSEVIIGASNAPSPTFVIPVIGDTGDFALYNMNSQYPQDVDLKSLSRCTSFQVRISDNFGTTPLNNADWSMTLLLESDL